MKTLLSIIAICFGIIQTMAYNTSEVFKEGTHWQINGAAIALNPNGSPNGTVTWPEIEVLEGKSNILGKECFMLWRYSDSPAEKELIAYIYTDNEKVYFANPTNPETWNLLYDFNIEEGDTFTYSYPFDLTGEIIDCVLKCTNISSNEIYSYLPTIELSTVNDNDDINSWPNACWIKGNGSIYGLLHPSLDFVGIGYALQKVWNGDKVFMEVKTSGVQMPETSNIEIKTLNNAIQIIGATPGTMVKVFDICGNLISENMAYDTTLSIPADFTGIYLIQVNNKVFKTMIR